MRGAEIRTNYCTLYYRLSHVCLLIDKKKGVSSNDTASVKVYDVRDIKSETPLDRNLDETENWQVTGKCGISHAEAVVDST